MRRLFTFGLLALVGVASASLTPSSSVIENVAKDMDRVIRVTNSHGSLFEQAQGHQNIEYAAEMKMTSSFMIGSNSKLYTTVAIYQLHEAGKIDVSADVSTMLDAADFKAFGYPGQDKFCPRMPGNTTCEPMTLQQVLAMASGIYPELNCQVPTTSPSQCNPLMFVSPWANIAGLVGTFINQPLMFKPGTSYHYSNPNFILGTYLVEKFSGMTFEQYLKAHIFDVIGLQNTYFDRFNGQLGRFDPMRTTEYFKFYDNSTGDRITAGQMRLELDTGAAAGTGGLISTVHDQWKFYSTVFNASSSGAPLFSDPASQAALLSPFNYMETVPLYGHNASVYYSQGTVVLCYEPECTTGVQFVAYTGGTFGSHTANRIDLRPGHNMTMVSVWSSGLQSIVSPTELSEVQQAGFGTALNWAGQWGASSPSVDTMSWNLMFAFTGSSASEASEAAHNLAGVTRDLSRSFGK